MKLYGVYSYMVNNDGILIFISRAPY